MTRIAPLLAGLLASVLLPGCGGGGEAEQAATVPAPPPRAIPRPVAVAPSPVARAVDAENDGAEATPEQRPLGNAEGEVGTYVLGTDGDTFELVSTEPDPDENAFTVDPLAEGESPWSITVGSPPPAGGTPGGLRMPPNFQPIPAYGHDENGFPRRIACRTDRSIMVLVPGGHFTMGTDDGPENARPAIRVHLDAYYIDLAEVNVGQYLHFRETNGTSGRRIEYPSNRDADPYDPAIGVTFGDAGAYAKWCGKELPTEAEWEKAARGPNGAPFPWGDGRAMFSVSRTPDDVDRIMSFPQDTSYYGVFDMAGNAREWTRDWYDADAYRTAIDRGETFENWTGPGTANADFERVVKGNGPGWAAWHREGRTGGAGVQGVGFRCVLRYTAPGESRGN